MCYILNKHETFENWGRTFCFVCNPNDFIAGHMYETCIRHQNCDFTLVLRAVGHISEYGIYTFDLANPANDYMIFAFPSACTQSVDVVECRRVMDDVYSTNFEWLVHCLQCADSACSVESIYSFGFKSFHPYYWNLPSYQITNLFGVHAIMKDEHTDLQTRFDWLLGNYELLSSNSTCDEPLSGSTGTQNLESQLEKLTQEFKQYTQDSTAQLQQTCEQHEHVMHQLRDDNVQLRHELLQLQDRPIAYDDATVVALKSRVGEQQVLYNTQMKKLQDEHEQWKRAHLDRCAADLDEEKRKMQHELERSQSEFRLYAKESSIQLSELESTNQVMQQRLHETMRTNEQNEHALRETKRMLEVQANSSTSMTAHLALLDENQALTRKCVDYAEVHKKMVDLQAENDAHHATLARAVEKGKATQSELDQMLETYNALRVEFEQIKQKGVTINDACVKEDAIRELEASLQVERDAHAETSSTLQSQSRDMVTMRQLFTKLQKQHDEMRVELSARQNEHAEVIRTLQSDLVGNLEASRQTEHDAHAETSNAMQAQSRELISTRQALVQSQKKHDEMRAELSSLKIQLRSAHEDHAEVIRTLQSDLVDKLEASLQTERDAHAETSHAMQAQSRELIHTRQKLTQSQKKNDETRAELSALQSALRAAHDDHADVIRTLQSDLVDKLEASLQTERDAHAETSHAMQEQTRDLITTRNALTQSQKKNDETCAELSALQSALRAAHDDHADVIRTLQSDLVDKLEKSLQTERDAHAETSNAMQAVTRELVTTRQACTQSQLQNEITRSELHALQNERRIVGGGASNIEVRSDALGGPPNDERVITRDSKSTAPTIVERAASTSELSTLVSIVQLADFVTTLSGAGPFTVFAPTNAAFDALSSSARTSLLAPENRSQLARVLKNHVVRGIVRSTDLRTLCRIKTLDDSDLSITSRTNETFVANARVITADLTCANGVVHMVDRVIVDPTKSTAPTIVERAASTSELSTLVSIVQLADFVTTLSGAGPFTVFAPTNAAFDALSSSARTSLLAPENRSQLARVLKNHVVRGIVRSTDLRTLCRIKTLDDSDLSITSRTNETFVANARVITADLTCANGVVHMVDRVIVDPTKHNAPPERLKHGTKFADMWEHPPFSTISALDDMQAVYALSDTQTLHRFINRVVGLLRNSTNVTQMAALVTLYIVLRR